MVKSSTTRSCASYGHLEFQIEFEAELVLQSDVDSFLSYIAEQVKNGVKYNVGQLIQIGWMMDRIDEKAGKLTLLEPDFIDIPIRYVHGATGTFRHLRSQKGVAESLGLEALLDFPTILHSAIVCNRQEDRVDFVMERARPENRDSGWFVGCGDPDHDHNNANNLRRTSLYEIARNRPNCIPFFALPARSFLQMKAGKLEVRCNNEKVKIKENSFLERFIASD
ncbi:conserved hypothetical protein [Verrucomicrobia bacterium]|nr:conserved hypothetical protein [Verrucomicrobiota bacterium]